MKRVLVSLAALLAGLALVVGMAAPSQAARKHVTVRVDTWVKIVKVSVPSFPLPETFRMRMTANALYYHWVTGRGPHQKAYIAPFRTQGCYTFLDGKSPSLLFDGVKVNPYYTDGPGVVNPPTFKIPDQGKQGCKSQKVRDDARRWLDMDSKPTWQAQGSVVWKGYRDQGFHWAQSNGSHIRPFVPSQDFIVQSKTIFGNWPIK